MSQANPTRTGTGVAFIVHRFPYLTETFIVRDMLELDRLGVGITIFSLLSPQHSVVTADARTLLPLTRYSPLFSAAIVRSNWQYLRRSPRRYVRALVELIRQTWREPSVLARSLLLFPKTVDIARRCEELGIGHVHANFVWLEALAAGVISDLTDIPFSIRPHAFGLFGRKPACVRRQLAKADTVVTISEYHRRYVNLLVKASHPQVGVVHLGLDSSRFVPAPGERPPGPVRILSIGRGVEKKGHRHLVDACAELAHRGIDFRCTLVMGEGAERDALQSQVAGLDLGERVSFLDYRDEAGIIELYQTHDVFALACVVAASGDRDGMPNVLLEAMACGLPVVTTPVAGIPELVVDGHNGFLVAQREVIGLADALERLIADPVLRDRLGGNGRKTVIESFEIKNTARELAGVFGRVSPALGWEPSRATGGME